MFISCVICLFLVFMLEKNVVRKKGSIRVICIIVIVIVKFINKFFCMCVDVIVYFGMKSSY